MAILYAAPLIALAVMATPVRAPAPGVVLTLGREAGVVVVSNRTALEQWLARALTLQRRAGRVWIPVPANFNIIARCDERLGDRTQPVRLRPGQAVTVARWTGEDCNGQCPRSCRLNAYLGPGTFRVIARTWPGGIAIFSPAFDMPAVPPERREYTASISYRSRAAGGRQPKRALSAYRL